MEQLLWNFDQVKEFAHHPDTPLRRWALGRLTELFPDRAGEVLVTMLNDQTIYIAHKALNFLSQTGQPETYGPILLEHLQQAKGDRFGRLALALAKLNYRPALPVVLEHLKHRGLELIELSDFSPMAEALGRFGGAEVRQTLWEIINQESPPELTRLALLGALAEAAQPEDVPGLIAYWRTWPDNKGGAGLFIMRSDPAKILADTVEVKRLVDEMKLFLKEGLTAMLERAVWWLGADIELSRPCMKDLKRAIDRQKYTDVPEILWAEAQVLAERQGDDLAGWQAAWSAGEHLVGYRRRTIYTWLILKALAEPPATPLSRQQQEKEALLGLGLLAQWSGDRDDQARLESATDKTETLLAILTDPRQQVLPDIVEQVANLGPEVAPRLIDLLDPDDWSWGAVRIIQTLKRLARLYPGSVDAAVPKLIQAVNEEQGDYIKEEASDALVAIGPPAVAQINQELRATQDSSATIYLTDVLGHIPVERATEVILARIEAGQPIGEMEFNALSNIGSARAIEPLYQLWQPGDALLPQDLLILCELNDVQKPELPQWRQLVAAEEKRLKKILSGETSLEDMDPQEMLKQVASGEHPLSREWQLEGKQAAPSFDSPPATGRRCPEDGFPMVQINGQWQCVAGYLDRCLGQQPVVDVIKHRGTVYYVFEDGHQLPLLCSCCDGSLLIDVKQERRDKIGRHLEDLGIGHSQLEDGQEIEELLLQFSKKGLLSSRVAIPVSFQVAARMRHPADCPYGSRSQVSTKSKAIKSKKRKKRRRGRKRGGRN